MSYNDGVKKIIIFAGIIVVVFLFFNGKTDENQPNILKVGEISLNIEVADTDAERTQGLSGREGLEEGSGLLFVFEREGYYGFWMKDMNFPIDIAWIDKNKKVTHIEAGVSPETYPKIFNPEIKNLYVLELPAGFLVKNNIQIGDFVDF